MSIHRDRYLKRLNQVREGLEDGQIKKYLVINGKGGDYLKDIPGDIWRFPVPQNGRDLGKDIPIQDYLAHLESHDECRSHPIRATAYRGKRLN